MSGNPDEVWPMHPSNLTEIDPFTGTFRTICELSSSDLVDQSVLIVPDSDSQATQLLLWNYIENTIEIWVADEQKIPSNRIVAPDCGVYAKCCNDILSVSHVKLPQSLTANYAVIVDWWPDPSTSDTLLVRFYIFLTNFGLN